MTLPLRHKNLVCNDSFEKFKWKPLAPSKKKYEHFSIALFCELHQIFRLHAAIANLFFVKQWVTTTKDIYVLFNFAVIDAIAVKRVTYRIFILWFAVLMSRHYFILLFDIKVFWKIFLEYVWYDPEAVIF